MYINMWTNPDDDLFHTLLVLTVKDYLSNDYARKHINDHLFLSRWFKGYTRLEVRGMDRDFSFVEYCDQLLGISPLNAEEIRKMIVEYRYGDEETRRRITRDCFSRLEENHEHNDPDPWWKGPVAFEEQRAVREATPTTSRGRRSTYFVFT